MVREDGHALGLKPNFSILDADDVTSILKDCAGGTTDAATARQWQWGISAWKNQGLNARQALALAKDDHERSLAIIMQRYEERLTAYQSVDFDDLIGMPMRLLHNHPEVREKWQKLLACSRTMVSSTRAEGVRSGACISARASRKAAL